MGAGMRFVRRHPLKKKYRLGCAVVGVILIASLAVLLTRPTQKRPSGQHVATTAQTVVKKHQPRRHAVVRKPQNVMRRPIDWRKSSETVPYPAVQKYPHLEFDVSIRQQRVFLRSGNKTLYTMYASTGKNDSTPRGDFAIQAERGASFYNPEDQGGANYYTSWYVHGVYLFHTVPTDKAGNYIPAAAALLGTASDSHGCVRLSIPDARWINENARVGMRVHVY